jgi:hypothetical protein
VGGLTHWMKQWMVGWTALAYQQYITYLSARENEDQESKALATA